MVHTNATNAPGGGPRDGEKQAEAMQALGQNKTDCMNTVELLVVVHVVVDVIMVHNVLVIFDISVRIVIGPSVVLVVQIDIPPCYYRCSRSVNNGRCACETCGARIPSVLVELFQWCKMWLMCIRSVLAVTTLLIIIFLLVVIAMSRVIIMPELFTYVMCRLFYHDSISLIIRKRNYMQRMQGGGPRMQGQL